MSAASARTESDSLRYVLCRITYNKEKGVLEFCDWNDAGIGDPVPIQYAFRLKGYRELAYLELLPEDFPIGTLLYLGDRLVATVVRDTEVPVQLWYCYRSGGAATGLPFLRLTPEALSSVPPGFLFREHDEEMVADVVIKLPGLLRK